ncbi:MAG: hypothetical protein GY788_23630 [bacterium]|nr:hypothetical protein [bacterium]
MKFTEFAELILEGILPEGDEDRVLPSSELGEDLCLDSFGVVEAVVRVDELAQETRGVGIPVEFGDGHPVTIGELHAWYESLPCVSE